MDSVVFGVGDEVLISFLLLSILFLTVLIGVRRTGWRQILRPVRNVFWRFVPFAQPEDNGNRVENVEPSRTYHSDRCPICLNVHRLAVETNCGHPFCGNCLRTYIYTGGIMSQVNCPLCRQLVVMLFVSFTPQELQSAPDSSIGGEMRLIRNMVETYNHRFSGGPRTLMEMLNDMPILLRHLWNEFFSVGGLMMMFRLRIVLCFIAAIVYVFYPLDIIPEAVFGAIGFLDDIFVILVLPVYFSIIYHRLVSSRGQNHD